MRATYKSPPSASTVLLVLFLDSSVPEDMVDVDEIRLRQIIVNLVSNALKFTDRGFVRVNVSCDWGSGPHGVARSGPADSQGGGAVGDEARGKDGMHHPVATKSACCGGGWWSRSSRWCSSGRNGGSNNVTEDGNRIDSLPGVAASNYLCGACGDDGSGEATKEGDNTSSATDRAGVKRTIGTLTISVSDTGIGIPPEVLEGLFNPFVQGARTARSHAVGGTGLGLTISKSLAQLMGGDISCTSEVGKGSTFTFTVQVGLYDNRDRSSETSSVGDDADTVFLGMEGGGEAKGGAGVPAPRGEGKLLRSSPLRTPPLCGVYASVCFRATAIVIRDIRVISRYQNRLT